MFVHGSTSLQLSFWHRHFWGPLVPFVMTDEFSVTKNYLKNWYLMNSQPFYVFIFNLFELDELSKACKPDNFESHNYLKLGFTNIWGLLSNFVDCESFLQSNSPDILALCETNQDDSIDSGNFSERGYLLLIQKGF